MIQGVQESHDKVRALQTQLPNSFTMAVRVEQAAPQVSEDKWSKFSNFPHSSGTTTL